MTITVLRSVKVRLLQFNLGIPKQKWTSIIIIYNSPITVQLAKESCARAGGGGAATSTVQACNL